LQVLFTAMLDAICKAALDMAPEATEEMASLPARLYSGQGGGYSVLSEGCVSNAVGPRLGPPRCRCDLPRRQRLPLRLPPKPHDELTQTFEALKLTCEKAEPTKRQGNKWVSAEMWHLISHPLMLCRTGKLCQTAARTMQRQIWAMLRRDRKAQTAQVGNLIEAKFAGGDVQEAFCHFKGWYRAASETTTCPCPQTMVRQTAEWVELYAQRDWTPQGTPSPLILTRSR
jgi:hypothetical protein